MGRDKALLPWGETDLLGHTLARLRALTDDVQILSGDEARYADRDVPVHPDRARRRRPARRRAHRPGTSGRGPGCSSPSTSRSSRPRSSSGSPSWPRASMRSFPSSARGPEPLCALYGPGCLEPVRRRIAARDLKMTAFWPDVRVREVSPGELAVFGDPDVLFLNVNAPGDYRRALAFSGP